MHARMVEALEAQAALAAMRESLIVEPRIAAEVIDSGGPLHAAGDVHAHIVGRARGRTARRPTPVRRTLASPTGA